MRIAVATTMVVTVAMTVHRNMGVELSVPTASRWIVERANRGKLRKCVRRHAFFDSRLRSSDVTSTASARYRAMTPHATASVWYVVAPGTRMSSQPNDTYESSTSETRWVPMNTTERPPRNR